MDILHQRLMDKVYGRMKYVYDATRPLFLAGRARIRRAIRPRPGQRLLEVGCGTGRNLILLARQWPEAIFTGLDISSEMLSYASDQVKQHRQAARISLFEGELEDYLMDKDRLEDFDYILFSYSLSMIPNWKPTLSQALSILRPESGQLLIADFGACEKWPGLLVRRLYKNLSYFQVTPRTEIVSFLTAELTNEALSVQQESLLGGYGQLLRVSRLTPAYTVNDKNKVTPARAAR
jgi:S-adenosylmethionine-diacylgycerolhomoserine-N-methlytransferase